MSDDEEKVQPRGAVDVRSRTSQKEVRVANERAMSALVERLVPLSDARLRVIGLDEPVVDAIRDLRTIESAPARARHVRLVRSLIRDLDWALIMRSLDRLGVGAGIEDEMPSEAARWAVELPIQKDAGIARFLDQYPDADRRRLRVLVMNVARAPDDRRDKPRRQLQQLLEATLRDAALRDEAAAQKGDDDGASHDWILMGPPRGRGSDDAPAAATDEDEAEDD